MDLDDKHLDKFAKSESENYNAHRKFVDYQDYHRNMIFGETVHHYHKLNYNGWTNDIMFH